MSSPLAIAAVSAVLRSFLQNSVIKHDLAALLGIRTETVCRVLRKRVRAEEPSDEGA